MQLIKKRLAIFVLSLFIFGNANAITIDIFSTSTDPIESESFTFGTYIFKTTNGNRLFLRPEDGGFLLGASNIGDFTLSRTNPELGSFSLLSIDHAGVGISLIGGDSDSLIDGDEVSHNGSLNFLNHSFTRGDPRFTNVSSILFSPTSGSSIQITSFEVQAVPVPAAAWLFGSGLLGLVGVARRKKA